MRKKSKDAKVRVSVVRVTPEMAREWLLKNICNRVLSASKVADYARAMAAGLWKLTAQGIEFDSLGRLINGQHRLHACVESNCSFDVLVMTGLDPDTVTAIDCGKARSAEDSLVLSGNFGAINKDHIAVFRGLFVYGPETSREGLSPVEIADRIAPFLPAIRFSVDVLKGTKKGVAVAPVRTVICRAWFTCDRSKLERFGKVLTTGIASSDAEQPIVALREYLLENSSNGSQGSRTRKYEKTESALRSYLDGTQIRNLRGAKSELFPLPTEPSCILPEATA